MIALQRHVLKYERLLKNTRRPDVLVKEIKVLIILYIVHSYQCQFCEVGCCLHRCLYWSHNIPYTQSGERSSTSSLLDVGLSRRAAVGDAHKHSGLE